MKTVAKTIPGYSYGAADVHSSPVSMQDLELLKASAGFTEEDARYLRLAGEVLSDQTEKIVAHWRSGIIAGIPNLARHSRTPEGKAIPEYLANSNRRSEQWILDTCLRPYIRVDQLSAGNRVAAYHREEEQSGRGTVHRVRATARCSGDLWR